jgi:general secretion pathway protein M
MNIEQSLDAKPSWLPLVATAGYVGLVIVLAYLACSSVADIFDRRAALAASSTTLAQLEGRRALSRVAGVADGPPTGSPFLEGPTVTVAAADLLQHVASAINRAGGNVLSSQVELEGAQSKAGFIGVTVASEIEQPALQRLLYDLEAGMPHLFVDQLTAQALESFAESRGRVRVELRVSGQWQGGR